MERIYDLIPIEESANARAFHADRGKQYVLTSHLTNATYNQIAPRQYQLTPLPLDYNRDIPREYRLYETRDNESSLHKQVLGYAALSATMIVAGAAKNYIESQTGIGIFDSTAGMVGQGLAFLAVNSRYAEHMARIYGFQKTADAIAKVQPWVAVGLGGTLIESVYTPQFDNIRLTLEDSVERGMQSFEQLQFNFPDMHLDEFQIPDWFSLPNQSIDVPIPPYQSDYPDSLLTPPDMPGEYQEIPKAPPDNIPLDDNPFKTEPPQKLPEVPSDMDSIEDIMRIAEGSTDKATGASLSGTLADESLIYDGRTVRTPEIFMSKIQAFTNSEDVAFNEPLIREVFQRIWKLRSQYVLTDQQIFSLYGQEIGHSALEVKKLWLVGNGNMNVSQEILELARKFGLIT